MHFVISRFQNKDSRIVLSLFLAYFLIFPLLSDVEFNLRENGNPSGVLETVPYRLVSGFLYLIPYLICYKLIIEKYLLTKKILLFGTLLLIFLFLFNFYTFLVNTLVAQLNFSPVRVSSAQGIDFEKAFDLNFSIMYVMRELLVITALAYFMRSASQERQMHELKQEHLQSELSYLKMQLQPHFFFNTLNNIYALTLQRSEKAAPLVAKHAEMMRYILYDTSSPRVSLNQEIAFLKNYTEVESIRYSNKIAITFESQGISGSLQIEPLLLLPFVENAFKHGISDETSNGYIEILFSQADQELSMEITNSKACEKPMNGSNKGIGLQNAAKRLNILYSGKHTLQVKDQHNFYAVRLSINLDTDEQLHNS